MFVDGHWMVFYAGSSMGEFLQLHIHIWCNLGSVVICAIKRLIIEK